MDRSDGFDPQSRAVLAMLRPEGVGVIPVGLQNSLEIIVQNAPFAMTMLDEDFRHLAASDEYSALLRADKSGLLGKTHEELFSSLPADWELAQKRCLAGESHRFEHDWTTGTNGERRRMNWHLHPWRKSRSRIGGAILFLQEIPAIDQSQQAEESDLQFQHAQKMESVCRLAARIAHDLNNMLLVINGYSAMLAEDLADDHRLAGEARSIQHAGERTARLADELLSLSRFEGLGLNAR